MEAQLQFFSYVEDGATTKDVKSLFSAHYDTVNAGPKLEAVSYKKICREMGVDVNKVTFMTDNVKGTLTSHRVVQFQGSNLSETATGRSILTALYPTRLQSPPASLLQHDPDVKHRPSLALVCQRRLITRPRTSSHHQTQR